MKDKILEITNLKKTYHDSFGEIEALKDITFHVYKNEFLSIVGPSGCGKSTILSILSSLIDFPSECIKFNKENS